MYIEGRWAFNLASVCLANTEVMCSNNIFNHDHVSLPLAMFYWVALQPGR
jgi:hypothetical protein